VALINIIIIMLTPRHSINTAAAVALFCCVLLRWITGEPGAAPLWARWQWGRPRRLVGFVRAAGDASLVRTSIAADSG
jgi:hypothetical protein